MPWKHRTIGCSCSPDELVAHHGDGGTRVCADCRTCDDKDTFVMQAASSAANAGTMEPSLKDCVVSDQRRFAMPVFLGMILGALMLVGGVYMYDSMQTSAVANGQVAQANRTIVNWDVAASDWNALKRRAHDDWIKLSSK
jgi:hypothetical protein